MKIKLVSVSAAQGSNINVSYNLFCKYERKIHNSTDNKFPDYTQFLVDTPLKVFSIFWMYCNGFGAIFPLYLVLKFDINQARLPC